MKRLITALVISAICAGIGVFISYSANATDHLVGIVAFCAILGFVFGTSFNYRIV